MTTLPEIVTHAEWDEAKHPRADNGEFGKGNSTVGGVPAADRWGREHFSVWAASLDAAERKALDSYGYNSRILNDALRAGGTLTDGQERTAAGLDSAISKGSAPEDMTVYRGFNGPVVKHILALAESGGTLDNAGYTSCSLDRNTAAKRFGRGGMVMEIDIPKGSHGVYVDEAMPEDERAGQAEWLAGRGLRLRITSAKQEGGMWVVKAEPAPAAEKHSEGGAGMTTAALPAVLGLPPALDTFAEADWTAQKGPRGGTVWVNKSGRKVYSNENPGKSKRKCTDAKAPGVAQAGRSGKKTPTDPAKVHDAVKAILAQPEALDDPKAEAELARHISTLGMKDARALAAKLESGVKDRSIAGLAKKLAADAIAKVKSKGGAKPEPEKLPPAPESGKTDVSFDRSEADAIASLMPDADSYQTAEMWDRAPESVRPKLHAALLRLMDEGAIRPVSNLDSRGAGSQIPPEERAKMPQEGEYYFPSVAVFDPERVRGVLHGLAAKGGKG